MFNFNLSGFGIGLCCSRHVFPFLHNSIENIIIVNLNWLTNEPLVSNIIKSVAIQFNNFIFIESQVSSSLPVPSVSVVNNFGIYRKFESHIFCFSYVRHYAVESGNSGKVSKQKQIFGVCLICFDGTRNTVSKKPIINTYIKRFGCFPTQVWVSQIGRIVTIHNFIVH